MNPFPNLRSLLLFLGALGLLSLPTLVFADEVFVPLTSIPGIDAVTSNADSLSAFLNTVYRLCVGAAAVIAVIQITRAGVLYMVQDSYHSKVDAKHLIRSSIFGLVLVLAPTIVFSIIDPRILDLKLDASGLRLRELGSIDTGNGEEAPPPGQTDPGIRAAAAQACGFSLTAEEEACFVEDSERDGGVTYASRCLGSDRTREQVECFDRQANRADEPDDPGTGATYGDSSLFPGTYIGFAIMNSVYRGNTPVGADELAQQWLGETCRAPKQGSVGACISRYQDPPQHCLQISALCKTSSVTANVYRVKEPGDWLWDDPWKPLARTDNSTIVTFRNECERAAREMRGEGVSSRYSSPTTCSAETITSSGRVYTEGNEYQCAQETYTCDVLPR